MEDYNELFSKARNYLQTKKRSTELLDAFHSKLILQFHETGIQKIILKEILGDVMETNDISELVQLGFLIRKNLDFYLFSVPSAGKVLSTLKGCRKEIVGILKRQRFKEMLEDDLVKRKLKNTPFGVEFYLDDMIGLNFLSRKETPSGRLITLHPSRNI
eukprot:TRINITY_DN50_c0_g1_i14.p1 TRINITY_DN50_c0_g1~~TRINITY_DN50_c0_g1_i14.p1  ORF type:complete len:159 (-),score=37.53 TRINITY_DN50_c0_g1_i14:303-779(-)